MNNIIVERIKRMWYRQSKKTKHTGCMLAIFLDDASANKLVIKNTNDKISTTEPISNLHITLFYFPDEKKLDKSCREFIRAMISQIKRKNINIAANVSGVGMFADKKEDGSQTLYASVNSPSIVELRNEIAKIFDNIGIEYSKEFSYTPHITLANVFAIPPDIEAPSFDIKLDSIALCVNDSRYFSIKI